jgi:hypothetical protein
VERLEHEAHVATAPERQRIVVAEVERRAVVDDHARIGPVEARDDIEQRGFARTRFAHDGDPFAVGDLEVYGVEQRRAGPEGLGEAADLEQLRTRR